jgi:hypothetical protein
MLDAWHSALSDFRTTWRWSDVDRDSGQSSDGRPYGPSDTTEISHNAITQLGIGIWLPTNQTNVAARSCMQQHDDSGERGVVWSSSCKLFIKQNNLKRVFLL